MPSLQKLQDLMNILRSGHHVRILSHKNPDGDSIGSMIAFAEICDYYGLTYDTILSDPLPKNLLFLEKNLNPIYFNPNDINELLNEQTDIIVFLDCGQLNRVGIIHESILPHQKIINIDHHLSNPFFGDFNCVHDISSTCELLYRIMLSLEIPLTLKSVEALYIGVLTDTGMFQFEKTTVDTHIMISDLLEYGIDHFGLFQQIYQSNPSTWIALLKKGFEKLELHDNDSVAFISLSLQDFDLSPKGFDDTHVFFPILLATESIRICVIFKEKEDQSISTSFRSKDPINVASIAQAFGGGGHTYAAGCRTSRYGLEEFKSMIYQEIKKHL